MLDFKHAGFCLAVAATLAACDTLLDIADDPTLIASQPWSCLAAPREPTPPKLERVAVQVRACDFISSNCSTAASGLTAKLCEKGDVGCSQPIRADIRDSDGSLDFEVETGGAAGNGFDGFLAVSSQDETFAPAFLFFNPAIREASKRPLVLPLVPASAVASTLVEAAGTRDPDPDRGFVFITALDCAGKPAESVTIEVDRPASEVSVIYFNQGVFDMAARETDGSGVAEVSNVSPGSVHVTAYRAGAMPEQIGDASLHVAAGTISYTSLVPSL